MTAATLDSVVRHQRDKNFVTPERDSDIGWALYYHGKPFCLCRNAEQRAGYRSAERQAKRDLSAERLTADIQQIAA